MKEFKYYSLQNPIYSPFICVNVMITEENYVRFPHQHDFYHVNRITKGSVDVVIQGKKYTMSEGMTFVLPPNIPHALYSKAGYVQIGMDIECKNDPKGLFEEFCRLCNGFTFVKFPIPQSLAEMQTEQLKSLLSDPTTLNMLRSVNIIESYFLDFLEKLRGNTTNNFTQKFNDLIKTQDPWLLSLNDMSKHLLLSRTELERQAHKNFGCGASEYSARLRFLKACELLKNDASIESISDTLGFCDVGHFSKFFTKRAGIPPGQYRKTIL